MKKIFLKGMSRIVGCAVAAFVLLASAACSSEDEPAVANPQTFSGIFTTSIPSMPSFEPIESENSVTVTWDNPEQTSATVRVEAFTISMTTPMGDRSYEIGSMTIPDVACAKTGSNITLEKPEFECQAGEFLTTGSLTGEIKDGILTLTILYKPGSMPFEVQSVLVGKE